MRNIIFRFSDSPTFARTLREGEQELSLPTGEIVGDGEWVLAIFELGENRRATAAAARGLHRGTVSAPVLAFERRDWERLIDFAEAPSIRQMAAAPEALPPEPPTEPTLFDFDQLSSPDLVPPSEPTPRATGFLKAPNARVLLVDDDDDICDVVGAMLHAMGLAVEAVPSAEEALALLRPRNFDLLVLDWNLPGITGLELCRRVRRERALSTIPVLFLTAHASSRDIVEAFSCGADDYVVKPFRAPELGARIFGLLRRSRMVSAASDL